MLLRFGVANHRSIRDYQELFLSASRRIKREGLVIPVPTLKEAAVPIAAIYGPNAAGKSNLIDAMDVMRRAVVGSHKSLGATDPIRRVPFRLDDATEGKPTRFDCTFIVDQQGADGQRSDQPESVFEYGFEYTATEFCKEWLYRIVRKERQSTRLLFERETRGGKVYVKAGSQLPRKNRTIMDLTRPNSLFLSAAAQNNHPLLTELYRHFAESWVILLEGRVMHETEIVDRLAGYEHLERLVELITTAVPQRRRKVGPERSCDGMIESLQTNQITGGPGPWRTIIPYWRNYSSWCRDMNSRGMRDGITKVGSCAR